MNSLCRNGNDDSISAITLYLTNAAENIQNARMAGKNLSEDEFVEVSEEEATVVSE